MYFIICIGFAELLNLIISVKGGTCFCFYFTFTGLLQIEGGGQLLSTLQAMEVSCVIEDQTIPHSVTWRRRHPCIAGQQMVCDIPSFCLVRH